MSFRICHIGCGAMSMRGHGPALSKYAIDHPDTELCGCCDLEAGKARVFAEKFGFGRIYTDYMEMLAFESPDAVSLVVPVDRTAEMAADILGSGYSVLMEKPPGMTSEQCRRIMNVKGVRKGVAFNRRYMPIVKRMNEITKTAKVDFIRYDFFRTGRRDRDFSTTAIHGIDTTLMLAGGRFLDICIQYQPIEGNPVGNIYISGETKAGTRLGMNFYPDSGMNAERAVIISAGTTYLLYIPIWDCPDYPGRIEVYGNGALHDVIKGNQDEMYITSGFYDEHRDFYESIRNGGDSPADMEQHLQSVQVMEAVRDKRPGISF